LKYPATIDELHFSILKLVHFNKRAIIKGVDPTQNMMAKMINSNKTKSQSNLVIESKVH
jgi:hypothetical protein